jgi:phosphate transport system substrate-binding protein
MSGDRGPRRPARPALALVVLTLLVAIAAAPASPAASLDADRAPRAQSRVNGTGSTYVGLAMQQWTAEAQVAGLQVNYTPTGSPDGLSRYRGGQVDFAGTEAEFSSLQVGGTVSRGYQYVPDVAGAVAVMYNIEDLAGREVDYLHLSRSTVAKIFMGEITSWDDPQIAADNAPANLRLPDLPINVVYRAGQSGTTALFYDFVREMEPAIFSRWAAENSLPTDVRIIQLDSSPNFAPHTQALSGSDQIAQFVASDAGLGSIAYDEFGYAKVYAANAAWIENASGRWVLPYAENISAALDSATLRPDLSQELSGVYRSTDPLAYPISAYSYLVTQCETVSDRPTCEGPYPNEGVTGTLTEWMRYIACEGQARMAQIGYSPLPTNLSQEVANSIARMEGTSPERLTRANCPNPRFSGSLGPGAQSPPDPYLSLTPTPTTPNGAPVATAPAAGDPNAPGVLVGGGGELGADGGTGGDASGGGGDGSSDGGGTGGGDDGGSTEAASGRVGANLAAGGGAGGWRQPAPVAYPLDAAGGSGWPLVLLLGALAVPVVISSVARRRRTAAVG